MLVDITVCSSDGCHWISFFTEISKGKSVNVNSIVGVRKDTHVNFLFKCYHPSFQIVNFCLRAFHECLQFCKTIVSSFNSMHEYIHPSLPGWGIAEGIWGLRLHSCGCDRCLAMSFILVNAFLSQT